MTGFPLAGQKPPAGWHAVRAQVEVRRCVASPPGGRWLLASIIPKLTVDVCQRRHWLCANGRPSWGPVRSEWGQPATKTAT
jgi:hypothetical protein